MAKTTKLTRSLAASVKALDKELTRLTAPHCANHTEHAVEALRAARRDLKALISLKTPLTPEESLESGFETMEPHEYAAYTR